MLYNNYKVNKYIENQQKFEISIFTHIYLTCIYYNGYAFLANR